MTNGYLMKNCLIMGIGESDTEIRAIMIEVQEGAIPFEKMTVSSALKKAIHEAATKLP
jgi:lipoate synthase